MRGRRVGIRFRREKCVNARPHLSEPRLLQPEAGPLPRGEGEATVATAITAISAAIVFETALGAAQGKPLAVATALAYPLTDLVLLGVAVGALASTGWRLDRTWVLLAVGIISFWLADSLYLVQTATGTYAAPAWFDIGWTLGLLLIALASWQPAVVHQPSTPDGLRFISVPLGFGSLGLGTLIYGCLTDMNPVAVGLSALSLVAVMARLMLTFRENRCHRRGLRCHHSVDMRFFESLDRIVQMEPWLTRDKAMIDPLKSIGIEKGKQFKPDSATQEILTQAALEAQALLRSLYENVFAEPFNEGTHWAFPASPEFAKAIQSDYAEPDIYPVDTRGLTYSFVYFSAKHIGAGQYYLMTINDKAGRPFEGSGTYRLNVPANAPVTLYWSCHRLRSRHARAYPQHAVGQPRLHHLRASEERRRLCGHPLWAQGARPEKNQTGFPPTQTAPSRSSSVSTDRRKHSSTRHGSCRTSRRRAETINDLEGCDVHSALSKELRSAILAFATVEDLEVVAGVGWEEAGEVPQAFGERRCGQQRILALAQIVVIKINCERKHVDGQGI